MRASACLLTLVAAALLATPSAAKAFNCSRVDLGGGPEGASLAWFTRTIPFTLFAAGTSDIPGDAEFQVLRDSFTVWGDVQVGGGLDTCGIAANPVDLVFTETPLSNVDRVGYDFVNPDLTENLLIFRDAGWDSGEPNIIALTTTTYDPVSGEILDADIEFNSAVFQFTIGDPVNIDLANTAVHEIGHFLGLAHTTVLGATMSATATPGEIYKRDLHCDDASGITFKYPRGAPNGYCDPPLPSCGNCAPPGSEPSDLQVRVTGQASNGELSGGCAEAPASWLGFAVVALLLATRRRAQTVFKPLAIFANWSR